ncbi:aldo/keto reductase [Consotaella salsifontis]|uniref:Aldo/keto reductase n=1 Tax=Consotaella salsifontis TaxID=1365950 RepID=A0A1T4SZ00_9HYPH|nr:aldo/keto reductase [Consotaella salsifontis]SKA33466.1 Aldo/keto reductase [Consotaella salsifontis]
MKIIEASGARIPAIGLGTYRLTGDLCTEMVARAIDVGYRHIDTARMYGNEAEVGKGIRASGIHRGELFVTTKIWWTDIGEKKLLRSAKEALEALAMDYVDLLLIHWPNADVPLEESIDALNRAKEKGLARHIGVANFPTALVDEADAMSGAPLVCNQVEYHPYLSQNALLDCAERHDMALVAYSPIGQGGEVLKDATIAQIAERHGKSPAQIALRWEIEQPRVGAIPRTSKLERLKSNIDIFDFSLDAEEHKAITALSKRRRRLVDPSFAPHWDVA